MNILQPHELSKFYPMHDKDRFQELVEGMKVSGYRDEFPIVLYEGKILDGRNRYAAALEAGVEPFIVQFSGDDPVEFVVQANSNRRDLEIGQRAAIALKIQKYLNDHYKSGKGGDRKNQFIKFDKLNNAQSEAAKKAGVSTGTLATVAKLEKEAPDLFEKVAKGELTPHAAQKEARAKEIRAYRSEIAQAGALVSVSEKWRVYQGDIKTWKAPKKYDFIITDPPYPKEFLPLWETLAIRANEWLKDGGLLIAMCGQSYLNQIYSMMSEHLTYYWTAAYLTPGQPTPLRQVNVNSTWKPLLIFSKGKYNGKIFGDVFVSDGNDKSLHKWGQSESGMYDIISKIVLEGQSILDPFCGAGTTLVAGLKHNCFVTGIELDEQNVNISKGRLAGL